MLSLQRVNLPQFVVFKYLHHKNEIRPILAGVCKHIWNWSSKSPTDIWKPFIQQQQKKNI